MARSATLDDKQLTAPAVSQVSIQSAPQAVARQPLLDRRPTPPRRPPATAKPVAGAADTLVGAADSVLVAAVISGDQTALRALYDRYARPVYSLALRITQDCDLAEEVTQETFLRLWRNGGSFSQERGRFATWLLSIAHHQAVDQVRRRRARPQVVATTDDAPILELPDTRLDVEEEAWTRVQRASIRAALGQLSASQRVVIELAYFDGLTHAEIAARLGEPLGTIKARLRLGLGHLRGLLLHPRPPARV